MSMPVRRILVINGHPDPTPEHLCAGLADAYAQAALAAGHQVERLNVGTLDFPLIRSLKDYQSPALTDDLRRAQDLAQACDHLVLVFPIWFGGPPALLKGFFEQLMRRGSSFSTPQAALFSLLSGKSARLIVTMGAPTAIFHWLLGGHGVSGLARGLLWVTGVSPIRTTLLGRAHLDDPTAKASWLRRMRTLGRRGA